MANRHEVYKAVNFELIASATPEDAQIHEQFGQVFEPVVPIDEIALGVETILEEGQSVIRDRSALLKIEEPGTDDFSEESWP